MKSDVAFSIFILVLLPQFCDADNPVFLREDTFSCTDISEALNHYISLGEKNAVKELIGSINPKEPHDRVGHRICFLSHILFGSKQGRLREPRFGGLQHPLDLVSMKDWPIYPMAKCNSTFFLLDEEYEVGGPRERPKEYIAYCRENGTFMSNRLHIPDKKEALADLEKLRRSDAWRKIEWNSTTEEGAYRFLNAQASRVRDNAKKLLPDR